MTGSYVRFIAPLFYFLQDLGSIEADVRHGVGRKGLHDGQQVFNGELFLGNLRHQLDGGENMRNEKVIRLLGRAEIKAFGLKIGATHFLVAAIQTADSKS